MIQLPLCALSHASYNPPLLRSSLMPFRVRLSLVLLLGLVALPPVRADTSVNVDIGWGGRARPGTWTPVFITVADPKPRNASLKVRIPHDSSTAMEIYQPISIGPS